MGVIQFGLEMNLFEILKKISKTKIITLTLDRAQPDYM